MDVTAKLLDKVGFDDLTTILIAKELKISVGSLYHYFPNKHAILRALAESWLSEWQQALEDVRAIELEQLDLATVAAKLNKRFLAVYQQQQGILPLVQAMFAVPELRDLDERHDELVISNMSSLFGRIGINHTPSEQKRIARVYLEMSHALLLVAAVQKGARAKKVLNDLNMLTTNLLEQYSN